MSTEAWSFLASLANVLVVSLLAVAVVSLLTAVSMMALSEKYKK